MNNKNNGKEKKIFDGCKFCMETRGFKCDNEPEEAYDILAGYYDEDEFDGFEPWEIAETLQEMALERELSMCYDEMAGCFIEDKEDLELLCMYYKDVSFYDIECVRKLTNIVYVNQPHISKNEIMVALDLVESIFCGQQHPTNEEKYQRAVEYLRNYEADDAYRLTPCWGNCDGMCELCPVDGHQKEYVFNDIEGRLNYIKESLQCEKIHLCSLYADLLDITLVLNQVADGRFNKFVSLIREVCVRMDKGEAEDCVALVVSLFETAKALTKVDKSYMKSKG